MCVCSTKWQKERFYDNLRSEWDLHSMGELLLGMGDFNGHIVNGLRVMRVCMAKIELGREMWKARCC